MKEREAIEEIVAQKGGIAKTADFIKAGYSASEVTTLSSSGAITKIRHGYYGCPSLSPISEEKLLSALFPDAVISMESALFHYGYIDFLPRAYSLSVPRTFSRSRFKAAPFPIKAYFVQPEEFPLGATRSLLNGENLLIYDRERTISDLFKHRNKVDAELFAKALKNYAKDEKKDLERLSLYAKKMRVYSKMKGIMEILVNE